MKTPITYYGGKQMLLKHILPLIPSHHLYCEPLFGGGAVLFAKEKSETEVINDSNGELINFFQVVKKQFPELQKEIQATLHSREMYKNAMVVYENPELFTNVKRAWALWVLTNQGFAGMIGSWGFGKDDSKEASLKNKRENFVKDYAERLSKVQIENNDALKVLARCNDKDTFAYCDPPYIGSDMGHYKGYTEENYKELLDALVKFKGKFLLSSYPSTILNSYIKKYKWRVKKIVKSVAVTKNTDKKKTELLVMNYEPADFSINGTKNNSMNNSKNKKQNKNPYADIYKECQFIERFIDFHDKILYKNTFEIYIDDLQQAIKEKRITKKSPVAKDIMNIQNACIQQFNTMKNAVHFVLKPQTIKHLKGIVEKWQNAHEDIDKEYLKLKKKSIDLEGLNGIQDSNLELLKPKVNVMNSTDFVSLQFNTLGFKDKWLKFIGDPSSGFTAMVYGMPKFGKSYLCLDFAGYLARNHGRVLYVAKEEKLDKTLQDKLRDKNVAHTNLVVADAIPSDLSGYDFIFLDSVNKLRLTPQDLEKLKADNKGKSFIYIFQATKGGQFKGNNEFQHDVDIVIEVPEIGRAVQYGRFNQGGEMEIFPKKNS